MQRLLIPALAAAVVAGGAWLAPTPASAQNYDQNYNRSQNYNRNNQNYSQRPNQGGATAWGDPWLNENDFDYNQQHWLPGPGDTRRGYSGDYDRNQDRYGRNDNNYSNSYNYNRDYRYGDNRNRGSYDNRYDRGYNQNQYNDNRYGLGRGYAPDNR